ncbi:p-hydroxybenzoic acid efflux pump subunit AaeA [Zhongshania aliphaticivorans]|uniref:p-hydroxybenzoic acid efflux pump subunit AaeA n=1 Tax=Zhongshania aliphaticivorans TaxID=1470434 RepID=A0A5S9MUA5_9GAMM|nr:efflux RND transporter periplasmic adaptor subunit [Zhongshania aliphaticivorans]CAA0080526.1 p-hydroxybenzoic acid efflux pump subunit AaeA [Zhongshania aliphaticivorans]CAA0085606.1 p-hydroxybenzoic acid efflux pump subunit AaeA [Zhongshania aliphaticivorans]
MSRKLSPTVILLLSVALLVTVILYVMSASKAQMNKPMPQPPEQHEKASVSVNDVTVGQYQASVIGHGEMQARYQLDLTAYVSGRIDSLSPLFEAGQFVKAGTVLAQIEDSDYQAAYAEAEYDVKAAQQALLEEEREQAQAELEWQASGLEGEPDSELVLRKPQLATAKAALQQAKATLSSAKIDLEQSQITAPFDAVIVSRDIAPGSYVQSGTAIGTLYSASRLEAEIPLSAQQWQNLPAEKDMLAEPALLVTVKDVETGATWSGKVLRTEGHLDSSTRQRALIVAVESPMTQSPVLIPGTFVQVTIQGRAIDGLWELPSSALSQRGSIWYIDANSQLASFDTSPQFSVGDKLYIAPPAPLSETSQQVLTHPLSSYIEGMAAQAQGTSTSAMKLAPRTEPQSPAGSAPRQKPEARPAGMPQESNHE